MKVKRVKIGIHSLRRLTIIRRRPGRRRGRSYARRPAPGGKEIIRTLLTGSPPASHNTQFLKETIMRRFLPVWVGWLILAAILLRGAAAFLPGNPFLSYSSKAEPALVRADLDSGEVLFQETFSVSQELSLQCRQEYRQSCPLAPSLVTSDSWWERANRWSVVQIRVAPLATLFFFPRKLSPPSAEDGPFLS